ncbi:MAG: SdpI family protein [Candidatus Komeilibacteria bacterium]|nr:SdpI family protein [Candidatus Komeilibacteria bacterium]
MQLNLKKEWLPWALIIVSWLASFYFYANFPDQVATHWNFAGEPDNYSGAGFAAFFFPGLITLIYIMFLYLPKLDPKKDNYAGFATTYNIIKNLLIAFMVLLYFFTGLNGVGYDIAINIVVPPAIGLFFIIIGNFMGKIKSNWFMGIRTPWALSNETVWNKTQRFGGKMFVLAGIILLLTPWIAEDMFMNLFIPTLLIVVLAPIVYSYIVYKQLK